MNLNRSRIVVGLFALTTSAIAASSLQNPHDGSDVGLAAMMLGLNAESLACVDVRPQEIPTVLARLDTEFDLYNQIIAQQENAGASQQVVLRCQGALRNSPSDPEVLIELQNAQAASLSAANAALQIRQELILTVLEELADDEMLTEVFFASGILNRLPAPYRFSVETDEEAKALSWALKIEARAQRSNSAPPSSATTLLAQARSQYDVSIAITRVQQYEDSNTIAIENWILNH